MIKSKVHFTDRKWYKMKKKFLIRFVMWYRKWVLGECRHYCNMCKFKKECVHDTEWLDINTLDVLDGETKTVLYSGDGYADGYMVYDMAECPNCGYEYEDGDKDWGLPFCPNCGQSLDWESEEKK